MTAVALFFTLVLLMEPIYLPWHVASAYHNNDLAFQKDHTLSEALLSYPSYIGDSHQEITIDPTLANYSMNRFLLFCFYAGVLYWEK